MVRFNFIILSLFFTFVFEGETVKALSFEEPMSGVNVQASVRQRVINVLKKMNLYSSEFDSDDAKFIMDMGFDELTWRAFVKALEKEFNMVLPHDEGHLSTIGKMVNYIAASKHD